MATPEKRISPRFKVSLAAKIVALNNEAVSLAAQTLDIGGGGVRLSSAAELPVGGTADYVITLSENDPPAKIYCAGKILRCTKNEDSWDAALSMVRYSFIRSDSSNRRDSQSIGPSWAYARRAAPADAVLADTR